MIANYTNQVIQILVDADSCPVMEEVTKVASKYNIPLILIASIAHYTKESPLVQKVYVDKGPQVVDMEIINRAKASDIIVTGDYGLASLILAKGAKVISPRGYIFSEKNIDRLLAQRHIGARIRRGGGKTKGPKPFTKMDRENFTDNLIKLIEGQL